MPSLEDFVDGGGPPHPPPAGNPLNLNNQPSLFEGNSSRPPLASRSNFFEPDPDNAVTSYIGSDNNGQIGNGLFGSQAAVRERKAKTQQEVDDFLYEQPEDIPELELGDGLLQTLNTETEDLLDPNAPPTKKEEKDETLKNLMVEYDIENIMDTMDGTGKVPDTVYFFYGGESEQFVNALEFIGLSPTNREFGAFLLSNLVRQTMTQNRFSIHVEPGDLFYNNHNTGENFSSFLLSQQNDEAAFVPRKLFYRSNFESYIGTFLQTFSIEDQEKLIQNIKKYKNI